VQNYPDSANVYDSLADALEAAGKLDEAQRNLQKAVDLGTANHDPALQAFQQHLTRVVAAVKAAKTKAVEAK